MDRREMREKFLKYYDVKTIVDRLFPDFDRERFLKELADYQRSRLERLFNPNKKLFEAYLKEETLPYEEWNHYKKALDRTFSFKEDLISSLLQKIESEKEKRRKIARARRMVVDSDDDLITKAVLLFFLYEALKGGDTVKAEEPENTQEPLSPKDSEDKQTHENHSVDNTTKTEMSDSQQDRELEESPENPDNYLFEEREKSPAYTKRRIMSQSWKKRTFIIIQITALTIMPAIPLTAVVPLITAVPLIVAIPLIVGVVGIATGNLLYYSHYG